MIRTLPKRATLQDQIFFIHFFLCYSKCLRLTFWELTTKESIQTHDIQIESHNFFFLLTANFMSKTVATTTIYMYIYCVYWCRCRNLLTPFNKCCNLLGHASRYLFRSSWWVQYGTLTVCVVHTKDKKTRSCLVVTRTTSRLIQKQL